MSNIGNGIVVPNLPGFTPARTNRKTKTQNFVYVNGYAIEKAQMPRADIGNRLDELARTKQAASDSQSSRPFRPGQSRMPAWLAHDRQVLAFQAYFKEAVNESAGEDHRIRKCEITFYLSDQSIAITEHKRENSGIPQGQFIKRHKIPLDGETRYVNLHDLKIGNTVTVYTRTFYIYACNGSTRKFLKESGMQVLPDQQVPDDAYTKRRSLVKENETGADSTVYRGMQKSAIKDFVEASMGKSMSQMNLKQFLKNDGRVLRFYCQWDDTAALYGMLHDYTLHYFLADDTIEILEVHEANSGAAEFPRLLNRQKLSKAIRALKPLGTKPGDDKDGCYHWKDLNIGISIRLFGRNVMLLDADPSTRDYYQTKGIMLGPGKAKKVILKPVVPEQEPPPPNGYGSEEDSLGSCHSLMPQPPKRDFVKLLSKARTNLKFSAKFDNTDHVVRTSDMDRKFVVTFFLADDTVAVFEPQRRNSGIVGGKFLKRQKLMNSRGKAMMPEDFFVGARVSLGSHMFLIDDIDEFSLKYMEQNKADFPMANIKVILRKLLRMLGNESGPIEEVFNTVDKDGSGFITMGELEELLGRYFNSCELTKQEVLTIMRFFDKDKSGKIEIAEFVGRIRNPNFDDDEARSFFQSGADHTTDYEKVVKGAQVMDVAAQETEKSLDYFHKSKAKPSEQPKLLQMFRITDKSMTGNLYTRRVKQDLLITQAGLSPMDAERVMKYYFPYNKPEDPISYCAFNAMLKARQ